MYTQVEHDGRSDEVAVEEPLEIRVDGKPLAVTMRTPGDDEELADGLVPLSERILCVSGRLSFELVQKAAVAGAPILVGVGAPSSLAISLAGDRRMTLCGFARNGRVNVYTGPERVRP
jgi:formate dehydrogenase assembly factor FdhD